MHYSFEPAKRPFIVVHYYLGSFLLSSSSIHRQFSFLLNPAVAPFLFFALVFVLLTRESAGGSSSLFFFFFFFTLDYIQSMSQLTQRSDLNPRASSIGTKRGSLRPTDAEILFSLKSYFARDMRQLSQLIEIKCTYHLFFFLQIRTCRNQRPIN